MKLVIIVLALLALRYIHVGRTEKRYAWLLSYAEHFLFWLRSKGIKNITLLLLLLISPILIIFLIFHHFAGFWIYGLIGFLLNLILFWYALWPVPPRQLEVEGFTPDKSADVASTVVIDQTGEISNASISQSKSREYSKRLLIEANQNTFAVIFWFLVLGVYGAILYRLINLLYRHIDEIAALADFSSLLRLLQKGLDWIPARLVALGYVLAGDFVPGYHAWRQYAGKNLDSNDNLLVVTGLSAAGKDPNNASKADIEENRQLVRLIDRTLIVWLFLIAIFVIGKVLY